MTKHRTHRTAYLLTLGNRIRSIRIWHKWTQSELAERCQVYQRDIQRYENGLSEPKAITVIALANALQVTTDFLLCRDYFNEGDNSIAKIQAENRRQSTEIAEERRI